MKTKAKTPKIVVRITDEDKPFKALADARQLSRIFKACGATVKVGGVVDTTSTVGYHDLPCFPEVAGSKVSIFTRPPTPPPTSTLEEKAHEASRQLNAALFDLAQSIRRDDLSFEATALEHEAKALFFKLKRLILHRKWLGDRGLAR